MKGHTEQFVGALFRVLAGEGHEEAQRRLLESYRSEASVGRDELAESLFAELVTVLHRHLGDREEVDVLTAASRNLLARFSTVIEVVPVAIVVVDGDGLVRLWNEGAERTFGWSESEMLSRSSARTLSPPPDVAESVRERLGAGERLDGVETRVRHRDGLLLDVRLWAAPLRVDGGPDGAAFVVADITERKQREQHLAVLDRVLRHNIRNDVNVVQGHLELLAESLPAGDERVAVMERRLANVIELSDAARHVEQLRGDGSERVASMDLGSVLRDRLDRLDEAHPEAEISASLPESARVVGHELLPYALDNLLGNALEHNDSETPRVAVELVTDADAGADADGVDADAARRVVRIADDGPGLPATEREVLTAATETPLTHSAGMGLWLASWIVRRSGGDLSVGDSRFGGTSVAVRLNAPPGERRTADEPPRRR